MDNISKQINDLSLEHNILQTSIDNKKREITNYQDELKKVEIEEALINNESQEHLATSKQVTQKIAELEQKIATILDDPFYSKTRVYVHPLGIKTFKEHIERLSRINPRTPYEFKFYPTNLHTTIFKKFVTAKVNSCMEK